MPRAAFLILIATFIFSGAVSADVVTFKSIRFEREANNGSSWTQLHFNANVKTSKYWKIISFTIDSSFNKKYLRTDLRFRDDWLSSRHFRSISKKDLYLGSGPLKPSESDFIKRLSPEERKLAAWIVSNSDELINFALESKNNFSEMGSKINFSKKSRDRWTELSRNGLFEKNIRKNLSPHFASEIRAYDKYATHSSLVLRTLIQPNLKKLEYYSGSIDGLWGSQTKAAIIKFERDNNLFPDGVLSSADRALLVEKVAELNRYSDVQKIKIREAKYEETISDLLQKLKKKSILEGQLSRLEKELEETTKKAQTWRKASASRQDIISNQQNQIARLRKAQSSNANVKKLEDELRLNLTKLASLEKDLEDTTKKAQTWRKASASRQDIISNQQNQIARLRKAQSSNANVKKLEDELELNLTKLASAQKAKVVLSTQLDQEIIAKKVAFDNLSQTTLEYEKLKKELVEALNHNETLSKKLAELEKENRLLLKQVESQNDSSDGRSAYQLSEEWLNVERYLSVQQIRFCQILANYSFEANAAADSRNQLMQNLVAVNRDNDIAALLPNGDYKDWVVKVAEIYATPTGDAAFLLRLPCDVTFGSGQLNGPNDLDGGYAATAEFGGLIYNQLAQLSEGDTVLISGKILTYDDIGALNQRLKFVTTLSGDQTSKRIDAKSRTAPSYFSSIGYLSKL